MSPLFGLTSSSRIPHRLYAVFLPTENPCEMVAKYEGDMKTCLERIAEAIKKSGKWLKELGENALKVNSKNFLDAGEKLPIILKLAEKIINDPKNFPYSPEVDAVHTIVQVAVAYWGFKHLRDQWQGKADPSGCQPSSNKNPAEQEQESESPESDPPLKYSAPQPTPSSLPDGLRPAPEWSYFEESDPRLIKTAKVAMLGLPLAAPALR